MPLLKQPESLVDASLHGVSKLIVDRFIFILKQMPVTEWMDGRDGFFYEDIKPLSEAIFGSVPFVFANELHNLLFDKASSLYTNVKTRRIIRQISREYKDNLVYIPLFTLASIHPSVTEIHSIQFPPETFDILFRILPNLKKMRILKFTTWYESFPCISNLIYNMSELRILHVYYFCSDNLIKNLVKFCPRLVELNAMCSYNVTDNCVKDIRKLQNLQTFGCIGTRVTYDGLVEIIDVVDVKHSDVFTFKHMLKMLKESNKTVHIKLKYATLFIPPKEELDFIKQYCANMSFVEIEQGIGEDCNFIDIPNIKNLRITTVSFLLMETVNSMLQVQGQYLSYLTLISVSGMDTRTLSIVGEFCPNLISLKLVCCILDADEGSPSYQSPDKFAKLEVVECNTFIPKACIFLLLSYCCNINCIKFTEQYDIDDNMLSTIMETNPLLELSDFFFTNCEFSRRTIVKLFNNCNKLRHLRNISLWHRVSSQQVEQFRTMLRNGNYVLELE